MSAAPVFTTAEIRRVESRAAEAGLDLMTRAGTAAAELAARLAADTGAPVLVVAGPGNNGGDAWVAAAQLAGRFHRVTVLDAGPAQPGAPQARDAKAAFLARRGAVVRQWPEGLRPALVVDGLLGIGLARPLEGAAAELVSRINASAAPVLALDVPSGVDAETGAVLGAAVRARHTITFIGRKPGLFTGEALDRVGTVHVDSLGVDPALLEGSPGELLSPDGVRGWLAPRERSAHKGAFGTLGIVGGSKGMVGAAILAGRAALHAGAGKVYCGLLAPDAPAVDFGAPELMLRSVDDTLAAEVLVAGPGAGLSPSQTTRSLFERSVLPAAIASAKPLVLDADALNALALLEPLQEQVASRTAPTILTPHPGEAARLLKSDTARVQADRLGSARALAERFRAHVVLKGAGSVIAGPEGRWRINTTGNPGLASGGTGDALAGFIGAFLAQRLEASRALALAVCLHGAAADACVARGDGPAGLTASDVIAEARRLLNAWT